MMLRERWRLSLNNLEHLKERPLPVALVTVLDAGPLLLCSEHLIFAISVYLEVRGAPCEPDSAYAIYALMASSDQPSQESSHSTLEVALDRYDCLLRDLDASGGPLRADVLD